MLINNDNDENDDNDDNSYRSIKEEDSNWIVKKMKHGQSPCLKIWIIDMVEAVSDECGNRDYCHGYNYHYLG